MQTSAEVSARAVAQTGDCVPVSVARRVPAWTGPRMRAVVENDRISRRMASISVPGIAHIVCASVMGERCA
ncbi:MAG: hypothetical protein VW453_02570 [Rhodospirillaceae bacterium]